MVDSPVGTGAAHHKQSAAAMAIIRSHGDAKMARATLLKVDLIQSPSAPIPVRGRCLGSVKLAANFGRRGGSCVNPIPSRNTAYEGGAQCASRFACIHLDAGGLHQLVDSSR